MCDDNDDDENVEEDLFNNEVVKRAKLRTNVINWAFDNNITHNALKGIINIINDHVGNLVLPKDPRTLLNTPQNVEIQHIGGNEYYWHNGLQFCLENLLCNVSNPLTITLNINMDGLPIYKSAREELWPILFNIFEFPKVKPMVIGVWQGIGKSTNLEKYLTPMVNELKKLMEHGIVINDHKITVKLRCFICESPARAFVKGDLSTI